MIRKRVDSKTENTRSLCKTVVHYTLCAVQYQSPCLRKGRLDLERIHRKATRTTKGINQLLSGVAAKAETPQPGRDILKVLLETHQNRITVGGQAEVVSSCPKAGSHEVKTKRGARGAGTPAKGGGSSRR